MYTVHLRLAGYTPESLRKATDWIKDLANFCNGLNIRSWSLPKRRHLITVLRSPHVNKKSREQFMETSRGRVIVAKYTPELAQIFVQLIERAHLPGVEVSIKIKKPGLFPSLFCIYLK